MQLLSAKGTMYDELQQQHDKLVGQVLQMLLQSSAICSACWPRQADEGDGKPSAHDVITSVHADDRYWQGTRRCAGVQHHSTAAQTPARHCRLCLSQCCSCCCSLQDEENRQLRLAALAHQGTEEQLAALQQQVSGREQRLEVLQQDKAYLSREVELLAGQIKEQRVGRLGWTRLCTVGVLQHMLANVALCVVHPQAQPWGMDVQHACTVPHLAVTVKDVL